MAIETLRKFRLAVTRRTTCACWWLEWRDDGGGVELHPKGALKEGMAHLAGDGGAGAAAPWMNLIPGRSRWLS